MTKLSDFAIAGPQGYQGSQGSQGAQGFQGNQGSQGFQGNQGSQGFQGFQGNQGSQGSQGLPSTVPGPQGSQGSQGAQGFQGNQGSQGNQGAQGPANPFEDSPGTNVTGDGLKVNMVAAEALAFGDVCYLNGSGQWAKADASASSTSRALGMAMGTIGASSSGDFLLLGFARNDAWNWTVGGTVYLSETAGAMTQTAPTTANSVTQVIGVAIHADRVYFNPSQDILVHA